jgi:hypothetical protein
MYLVMVTDVYYRSFYIVIIKNAWCVAISSYFRSSACGYLLLRVGQVPNGPT